MNDIKKSLAEATTNGAKRNEEPGPAQRGELTEGNLLLPERNRLSFRTNLPKGREVRNLLREF